MKLIAVATCDQRRQILIQFREKCRDKGKWNYFWYKYEYCANLCGAPDSLKSVVFYSLSLLYIAQTSYTMCKSTVFRTRLLVRASSPAHY